MKRRRMTWWVGGSALFIGVMFVVYPFFEDTLFGLPRRPFVPQTMVSLQEGEESPKLDHEAPTTTHPFLRVAFAPTISPEESIGLYQDFVRYLAKRVGRQPVMLHKSTYAETNLLIQYARCDVAFVCSYAFIRGQQEFHAECLAIPEIRGKKYYRSLVMVPVASRASSLLDLKDKRFASADVMSTTGWLFPAVWLRDRGQNPNRFFSDHLLTGSHDRSVQAVTSGFADGAAVDSLVFDSMLEKDSSLSEKVKIIATSPPYGMPPLAVSPHLDPLLKRRLLQVLLGMHHDLEGRMILKGLGIDRFSVPPAGLFDSVYELSKRFEGAP